MLGRNSEFAYKALHLVEGYSLRKQRMKPIMDRYPEFRDHVLSWLIRFYYYIILMPMLEFKKEILLNECMTQDRSQIEAYTNQEIRKAQELFKEEEKYLSEFEAKTKQKDKKTKRLAKLEHKVNMLAVQIHDTFEAFQHIAE